jgi:hypothetical protein
MARTAGPDSILNRNGWALLAVSILFCGLIAFLNLTYPGLETPELAVLVFAGGFLVSTAVMAGFKIFRII